MQLTNGSRVMIVGGGPAGSFTALHLLRFAAQAGLYLEITIFEARDFNSPGPGGCNKCAGILSSTLLRSLGTLDLELPSDIIQAELDSYVLHLNGEDVLINRPDLERRIFSVYRGGGPRLGIPPFSCSFDGWLSGVAQARGVVVRPERVVDVRRGAYPTVITGSHKFEAELVIVATGVNSRAPLDAAWGYHPPHTEMMAQDEIPFPSNLLDSHVHIFFEPPAGLVFGGLIPKGRYANISLLGHNLSPDAIAEFLEVHKLSMLLPEGVSLLCGCTPRVAISPAVGYYADRMAAVGDAAVTRLYKDGLGAAFITAEAAARTAVEGGISQRDFAAGYRPVCRRIAVDNLYGRMLFRLWNLTRRSTFLLGAWQQAIVQEGSQPTASQIYRRVLWGMFTGDESYRQIFGLSISRATLRLVWNAFRGRR